MVCSVTADAALQDDGHCPARAGGPQSSLGASETTGKTMMDETVLIRTAAAPQANHRE